MITWYFGLPSSSSHALIGGYAGAAIANAGFGVIIVSGWYKTLMFIALAPIIGIILGYILKVIISWLIRKQSLASVNKWSRVLQLFSAAAYSLGHGGNDAQKTMGIITSLLVAGGVISVFKIPLWVVLAAQAAIALGTISGGWRIIKTMGQKITKLTPIDGFCAETAAASSIFIATSHGRSSINHACHHRRNIRCWVSESILGGALECHAEYCCGVGSHHSGSGDYFCHSFFCNKIDYVACNRHYRCYNNK